MARVRVPKPFSQLTQEISHDAWVPLMSKYRAIDEKGRYLHWDEFQWRVDTGDDVTAAWCATKSSRMTISKSIQQLQAEENRCFSYCVPDSLFARLHTIDQMTGGGQSLSEGPFVSSNEKDRYLVKSLMLEEAITSSQLEGASTTRKVAKEMLIKHLPPRDKSQQMIFNNYLLMQKALENKDVELSVPLILELHSIATHKAIENQAKSGKIRQDNTVVVADLYGEQTFHPPDWQTLPSRLQQLCEFANTAHDEESSFLHPIIKAIILHFMIGYIHPFGDGNGRTARALFYWSMLRSGYWLFEYISISKLIKEKRGAYDKAFIYSETDEFDLTYFLYNQVDVIEKSVHALHAYIDQKKQDFYDFMAWVEQSPMAKQLKRGQLEILKEALRKPGQEFTTGQVASDLGIAVNTARGYLNGLVDKGLLRKTKADSGKNVIYIAPASLQSRLNIP
ncbi:MAG: Fic family protein [Cyanobacteria bacterium P01_D01_bin.156]